MGLIVSIPNTKSEIVSEQTADIDEAMGDVAEMLTSPEKLDTHCQGWSAKGAALAAGDDNPEFVVVRVEEGDSGNGRRWGSAALVSIAEQVNAKEPVGHWGHQNPATVSWEAPDVMTTWFGAMTKSELSTQASNKGRMVTAFYAAGYNLPGAKIRGYIKARAVRGISWQGKALMRKIPGTDLLNVEKINLSSLDWARKGAEGMPATSIVGVASEMKGDGVSDLQLAAVTPEQFKAENPNAYRLIVSETNAEHEATVSEMQDKVDELKAYEATVAEMRTALGLDEKVDIVAYVTDLAAKTAKIGLDGVNAIVAGILKEKVPSDTHRALVGRLLPVAEMVDKVKSISDPAEQEKAIGEMVDAVFNTDEQIKVIVSEMTVGGLPSRGGSGRRSHMEGGNGAIAGMVASVRKIG